VHGEKNADPSGADTASGSGPKASIGCVDQLAPGAVAQRTEAGAAQPDTLADGKNARSTRPRPPLRRRT